MGNWVKLKVVLYQDDQNILNNKPMTKIRCPICKGEGAIADIEAGREHRRVFLRRRRTLIRKLRKSGLTMQVIADFVGVSLAGVQKACNRKD